MAAKKTTPSKTGRGSVQAIEKRRAARRLNALLSGEAPAQKLDGRTEKRRQRLIKELKDGKNGKALKPMDVVMHTNELLGLGETLSSIKKNGVKPQKATAGDDVHDAVKQAQAHYKFKPEAWKMLGLNVDDEGNAVKATPRKRTAPAKKAAKKTAR